MATHHEDFGGLRADLGLTRRAVGRRQALRYIAGAGLLHVAGCAADAAGLDVDGDMCAATPSETAGPFPGDGSNGPNVLTQAGVVRSDIRGSFAGLVGDAQGVPLELRLRVVTLQSNCAPAPGLAVYVWHCDRAGLYSLYSAGATGANFLRGLQETDANGEVAFTTIFPGCYPGRWPHVHFEVYPSLDVAVSAANAMATSQLAFPESACVAAYDGTGYESSAVNLSGVSLASDGIFRDGADRQTAVMTGDASSGFAADLTIAV